MHQNDTKCFEFSTVRKPDESKQMAPFHATADMSVSQKFSIKATLREVIKFLRVHS